MRLGLEKENNWDELNNLVSLTGIDLLLLENLNLNK